MQTRLLISINLLYTSCAQISSCESLVSPAGQRLCTYDYFGGGLSYQILVGPVYIFVFTFSGILMGFLADRYNRKNLLALFLTLWSIVVVLMAFVTKFWQVLKESYLYINQTINSTINEAINQMIDQSARQTNGQIVNQFPDRDRSINKTIIKTINHLIDLSINQLIVPHKYPFCFVLDARYY